MINQGVFCRYRSKLEQYPEKKINFRVLIDTAKGIRRPKILSFLVFHLVATKIYKCSLLADNSPFHEKKCYREETAKKHESNYVLRQWIDFCFTTPRHQRLNS